MKTITKTLACILAINLLLVSCTKNFEEINTNPNSPEEAFPNLLLTGILESTLNETALRAFEQGNVITQLTAKFIFTDFDRYDWNASQTAGLWNVMYKNLRDNNTMKQLAKNLNNESYEGVSLILRTWMFANLTDNWGAIPYSEALNGLNSGKFKPVYDSQQEIYTRLLATLDSANTILSTAKSTINGDILYNGSVEKWQKLANSLKLRLLMRMSEVDPNQAEQGINEIISNPDNYPIINSNDDNAVMEYLARPNNWPFSDYRVGSFNEWRLSLNMENILKGNDDPRLYTWFRPIDNVDSTGVYLGVPNGLSDGSAESYNGGRSNLSRLSTLFYEQEDAVDAILMTYSEIQFILAEAAHRGWIGGSVDDYYQEGMRATFNYWNVDWETVSWASENEYMAQANVTLVHDNTDLERIIQQKWLSLFFTGYEAWNDYRRTGFPSFIVPGPENLNNNIVPVKFLYPDSEQSLNHDNWNNATGGTDDINKKIWWAK